MESFGQWAQLQKATSEYLMDETTDFTKFHSLEGQRIGDMNRKLKKLYDDYLIREKGFSEK